MNPRIQRLRADIVGDRGAFTKHLGVLAEHDPQADVSAGRSALVALSLHHAYCAVESILARIARTLEGGVQESGEWHRELLDGAFRDIPEVRPVIFDRVLASPLHDLRGFRHVVRHAYDVELNPVALGRLRAEALALAEPLARDLDALDDWLAALAAA